MSKTIVKLKNDILLDNRYVYKKVIQMKMAKTDAGEYRSYQNGACIAFTDEEINTADDLITFSSSGLITINYVGLVKVNVNLWLNSSNGTARPFIRLMDYTNNKVLAHAIDDNSSNYTSLTINNYVINNEATGTQYAIWISCNEEVKVDSGAGGTYSYINLEIL